MARPVGRDASQKLPQLCRCGRELLFSMPVKTKFPAGHSIVRKVWYLCPRCDQEPPGVLVGPDVG